MLVGLIVAVSMTTIDQTIVALSAPTIEAELGLTHDATQWAVNVYLVTTAAFFLLGGRAADVLGHKRMVLTGIIGFGATSLLCGLTPEGDAAAAWLITARALQGVTGAILFPAAIGLVVEGFPRQTRGRAMALFFIITGAMTALGPIAGGVLSVWTWRAIFWVNIPLAVAAVIIVAAAAAPSTRRRERIDWVGAVVVAVAIGAIVFAFQQASTWGWASPAVMGAFAAGAGLLVLFVILERRSRQPLVQLGAFRDRGFTLSVLASLSASIAFVPTFFFLSVYGQVSLGLTSLDTGLLFLKFFIGFVIAARIGSWMFDRAGAKPVFLLGGMIGVAGYVWLSSAVTVIPDEPDGFFNAQTFPILLAGAGIGFMLTPASADAVNRAIGTSFGEVTAVSQTARNFGGALGLALLSTIVTTSLTANLTASFTALGATPADAQNAVDQIGGAALTAAETTELPAAVREQFLAAVQTGYADAVHWAFAGMGIAMAVVAVLGILYPRHSISSHMTDPETSTAAQS